MKKILIILCCIIFLPLQALTAYARGILESLIVESSGLPENAVYMDMLIYMDENDEAYTSFNEENMKQYSFDTQAIAEYNSEGFISMSCHYKDNFTSMLIQSNTGGTCLNLFTLTKYSDGSIHQNQQLAYKLLNENRQFRIVVLDENGSIIQLSEPFNGSGKYGVLIDYIEYDVKNNTLSLDYEHGDAPLYWVLTINPKYVIIGIVIFIIVIKLLISRRRYKNDS